MTQFIDTLFFYSFSCSTVLVYGFGLEKTVFESRQGPRFLARVPGLLLDALVSVASLWLLVTRALIPSGFAYLVPMASILVCGIVHLFLSALIPPIRKASSGERLFFFGTVFLAGAEAVTFVDSLVIVCASVLSFTLVTAILFTIRERISTSHGRADWKGAPQILVSMGLLYIVLYSADVSWWLREVFR